MSHSFFWSLECEAPTTACAGENRARHADYRGASKQLEKDYIVMNKERSEADKRTAEHRAQADEVQRKVSPPLPSGSVLFKLSLRASAIIINHHSQRDITEHPLYFADGRSPDAQQSRASKVARRILGSLKENKWVPFSQKKQRRKN